MAERRGMRVLSSHPLVQGWRARNETGPSIERRVQEFLDADLDREDTRLVFTRILDQIDRIRAVRSRCTFGIVLLLGLFEVVSRPGLTEAEFLGVKLRDFEMIRLGIPVVIAFLFMRIGILAATARVYGVAYRSFVEHYLPTLRSSGIDDLLPSHARVVGLTERQFYRPGPQRTASSAILLVEIVVAGGLLVLLPVEHARLFTGEGNSTALLVGSVALTAGLYLLGTLYMFLLGPYVEDIREETQPPPRDVA
jgi:hypothetical protein